MRRVRQAIYGNHENAVAFHETAASYLADGHVFHGQFQQRGIISIFGQRDRCPAKDSLESRTCRSRPNETPWGRHWPLEGVVELDEKYLGGKPRFVRGVANHRGKGT